MLALFTPLRRELLAEIQRSPGTIDELSERLQRDASNVKLDVNELVEADIVTIEHDKVRAIAETVVFEPIPQLASKV